MTLAVIHFRQIDEDDHQLALAAAVIGVDASSERLIFSRPGTDAAARRAALLDAFEAVYRLAVSVPDALPFSLHISEPEVRSELERVAASFPAVALVRTARGQMPTLLHTAADSLSTHMVQLRTPQDQRPAEPQPELTVATDASKSSARRGVGVACISEDADLCQKMYPDARSVLEGELLAIKHALTRFPHRDLHVLTDSRAALASLSMTRSDLIERRSGAVMAAVTRIHELSAGRRVRFSWVRGHSGHRLNEAAHRLAVATRRNHEFNVAAETRAAITDNIVATVFADAAA
ncbi:hypothetical protein FCG67_14090 [Rhodococcus oryzae]|uniref:RNase H type-1 domain-containing protein n=1 Tax=Rhodococcus oryzae TaxID=2571143 RepID=A0ABY2RIE6_9NOCA|nr:RNase H family protein [Rhodococcus oryzae]TJZ76989.1 hypothetical protein FCG67_14090 [Rhodococcus oryzae]